MYVCVCGLEMQRSESALYVVEDIAWLHNCCSVIFHRSEARALKPSTAQMRYRNAFNAYVLIEQVILNFFPPAGGTSSANSSVEVFPYGLYMILTVTNFLHCLKD